MLNRILNSAIGTVCIFLLGALGTAGILYLAFNAHASMVHAVDNYGSRDTGTLAVSLPPDDRHVSQIVRVCRGYWSDEEYHDRNGKRINVYIVPADLSCELEPMIGGN